MVDTKLESEKHEEIVSNYERVAGVAKVDTKSDVSHDRQPSLDNQTSQGTNITSMDGSPMSSHVSSLATEEETIIAPTETTVNYIDNTDSDSDYSYMFYYYSGSEASESDTEDNGRSTPTSVLASKLFSCCLYGDSSTDSDAITDVNDASNGSTYIVVAGCRMCMAYIMVPAGTNVCFRCGNSGLIHFGGSGQA